jgi:hypothetical protein
VPLIIIVASYATDSTSSRYPDCLDYDPIPLISHSQELQQHDYKMSGRDEPLVLESLIGNRQNHRSNHRDNDDAMEIYDKQTLTFALMTSEALLRVDSTTTTTKEPKDSNNSKKTDSAVSSFDWPLEDLFQLARHIDSQRLESHTMTRATTSASTKTTTTTNKGPMMKRLNAFNYFYRDERDNLEQGMIVNGVLPPPVSDQSPSKMCALLRQRWCHDPWKPRRKHRKRDGPIPSSV